MNKAESVLLGIVTSTTLGSWLFQAVSVFVLAIIGALAGFMFTEYIKPAIKPKLDKLFGKKKQKA